MTTAWLSRPDQPGDKFFKPRRAALSPGRSIRIGCKFGVRGKVRTDVVARRAVIGRKFAGCGGAVACSVLVT